VLTFRKDPLLRRGHEDLGDCIDCEEGEGVEMGEGVAEIHQRRDKDQDVENEGSHIAQSHCGGKGGCIPQWRVELWLSEGCGAFLRRAGQRSVEMRMAVRMGRVIWWNFKIRPHATRFLIVTNTFDLHHPGLWRLRAVLCTTNN
jgi:hypothetical protein